MNKDDFTNELKELMSTMSKEEIEKTINALNLCKSAVYQKFNQEKGETARLLSTAEYHEAELHYIGEENKEGTIRTVGATLLTEYDFRLLWNKLPSTTDTWWLYNKVLITDNRYYCHADKGVIGKVRPVIIIDGIKGNLEPGEVFTINKWKFKLLTPSLAISEFCLGGSCTYSENYILSIIKFCIDGWYMRLINENKKRKPDVPTGI